MIFDSLKSAFPSITEAIGGLFAGRKIITLKAKNNPDSTIYQVAGDMHINTLSKEGLKASLRELLKEESLDDNKSGSTVYHHMDKLLDVLNSGKEFTAYELATKLMLSRNTIDRYIQVLLNEGKIEKVGTSWKNERFKLNTNTNNVNIHD